MVQTSHGDEQTTLLQLITLPSMLPFLRQLLERNPPLREAITVSDLGNISRNSHGNITPLSTLQKNPEGRAIIADFFEKYLPTPVAPLVAQSSASLFDPKEKAQYRLKIFETWIKTAVSTIQSEQMIDFSSVDLMDCERTQNKLGFYISTPSSRSPFCSALSRIRGYCQSVQKIIVSGSTFSQQSLADTGHIKEYLPQLKMIVIRSALLLHCAFQIFIYHPSFNAIIITHRYSLCAVG